MLYNFKKTIYIYIYMYVCMYGRGDPTRGGGAGIRPPLWIALASLESQVDMTTSLGHRSVLSISKSELRMPVLNSGRVWEPVTAAATP